MVVCILLYTILIASGSVAAKEERRRVLFLSSYHPAFPTFFQQIDGVETGLRAQGFGAERVTLDVEFMDSRRFESPWLREQLRRTLEFKLGSLPPYDVVIAGDDNALRFALDERDGLFAGLPVVFLGVNDLDLALAQNADDSVTGVVEAPSMADTLGLADRLAPTPGRLYVLIDDTPTARVNLEHYEAAEGMLQRLMPEVLSLGELTYPELQQALGAAGEGDAVLLIAAYRDHTGASMEVLEALAFLQRATDAPIYSPWDHGLGHGIVGGRVISHTAQGSEAGRIAGAILAGADPASFEVSRESPNRYILDYAAMRRHGLSTDALPAEATFINRPLRVWEQYPTEITVVAAASALMGGLILVLSYAVRQMRRSNRRLDAAQRELEISNERLESILDSAPDAVVIVDQTFQIIRFNKVAEDMFGWAEEEVLGRPLSLLVPPGQRAAHDRVTRAFLEDPTVRSHFMGDWQRVNGVRKDGGTFPINVALSKVERDGATIVTAIVRDMSDVAQTTRELARLSQRLERQLQVAEDANVAKTRFLANMSHELRTPLNAIIGFSEIMEQETLGPLGSAKYKEYVGDVMHSGLYLKSLVDDLLDFARIDEGRVELTLEPVPPRLLVAEALKAVRTLAWKQGLRLRGTAANDLPPAVVDRRAVHQCLLNLLSNAIKFSDAGGAVVLRAERTDGGGVAFVVEDQGPGIEPEMLPKLGQPFEQAGDLYRTAKQGAGLGLAITRSLTELMGGEMTIESELGRGTRITLALPAGQQEAVSA